MKTIKKFALFAVMAALIFGVAGCSDGSGDNAQKPHEHIFIETKINETTGMGERTCAICKASQTGPILKRGAKHDPNSTALYNTDNQFQAVLTATGATTGTNSNVNKIVFGFLSDENVKSAVETLSATKQEIGAVDGICYAYFDSESGTVYIVPSSEDAEFFIMNGSCNYLFSQYNNCTEIEGLGLCDTSRVTSMHSMFYQCSSLESVDVSGFDTSNVTDMYFMFAYCPLLESLDVSSFDTSNVTNMISMFRECSSLTNIDVSGFDTSNVTTMGGMFRECSSLTNIDVSGFDTSNVITMGSMFSGCEKLTNIDVSGFDMSNVTSMVSMFSGCEKLTSIDVSRFDTSKVTNTNSMFKDCAALTSVDVSGFDMSKVENTGFMFAGCSALKNVDVSNFKTSSATTMVAMFYGCENLESLDLSNFDTSKVTLMTSSAGYGMFQDCKALTELDLSSFDTAKVTTMQNMFAGCTNLETIYVKEPTTFVPSTITDESKKANMFKDCSKLTPGEELTKKPASE